jgi:hypothetical protein
MVTLLALLFLTAGSVHAQDGGPTGSYEKRTTLLITFPLPFLEAGGRFGLESPDSTKEYGFEGTLFIIPVKEEYRNDPPSGARLGVYGLYAPFSSDRWSWLYFSGRIYRTLSVAGSPDLDGTGLAFGLGYRRESATIVEGSRYLTIDLAGLERTALDNYVGALWVLRFFTAGFSW